MGRSLKVMITGKQVINGQVLLSCPHDAEGTTNGIFPCLARQHALDGMFEAAVGEAN